VIERKPESRRGKKRLLQKFVLYFNYFRLFFFKRKNYETFIIEERRNLLSCYPKEKGKIFNCQGAIDAGLTNSSLV